MQVLISDNAASKQQVTLKYLFLKFLKIGMASFGGFMGLVAMVQRELVDKDEVIEPEVITDAISIASLLPGPLAVSIVAYIGYYTKNKMGALVATVAVLLPATAGMLILSWCYFSYGYKSHWNDVLFYTTGAVSGIVLTTGFQIYKNEVGKNWYKVALCAIAVVFILFLKSYLVTIIVIAFGGMAGYLLRLGNAPASRSTEKSNGASGLLNWKMKLGAIVFGLIELAYILDLSRFLHNICLKITLVFSGISLSLFGGGYVMIPIMQSILVGNLKWITSREFLDGIAFSQLTPGPILVSSIFIGYKLKGIAGAIIALIATFAPAAILMIMVTKIFAVHKQRNWLRNCMAGIKPVVVGLILASAIKLLATVPVNAGVLVICVLTFFICLKYKVSPVYLIVASLMVGVCLTLFKI